MLDCCFSVYSSPSLLFVFLLPIGWMDQMFIVTFFGRDYLKLKGMLYWVCHILLGKSINVPFFFLIFCEFFLFPKIYYFEIFILLFYYRSRSRSPHHRRSGGSYRRRSPNSRSPSPRGEFYYWNKVRLYFVIDNRREERPKPSKREEHKRRRHSSASSGHSPRHDNG